MDSTQHTKRKQKASEGKYQGLYTHLNGLQAKEWRTSFSEVESVLGFDLPPSARRYNAWWANETKDTRHSQCLAWTAAGWETADVDMNAETLLFRRNGNRKIAHKPSLDEIWPVHPTKVWPEGISLRREDIYDDRI